MLFLALNWLFGLVLAIVGFSDFFIFGLFFWKKSDWKWLYFLFCVVLFWLFCGYLACFLAGLLAYLLVWLFDWLFDELINSGVNGLINFLPSIYICGGYKLWYNSCRESSQLRDSEENFFWIDDKQLICRFSAYRQVIWLFLGSWASEIASNLQ